MNLALGFHGFTETAEDFRRYSDLEAIGQRVGWHVECLQAHSLRNWITRDRPGRWNPDAIAVLERIGELGPQRVVLVGFSDGALFAHYFATRFSLQVWGVVLYAGGLGQTEEWMPVNHYRVLVLENERDLTGLLRKPQEILPAYLARGYLQTAGVTIYGAEGHFWSPSAGATIEAWLGGV